ncbi:MAG: porin, partial [Helicobacteraceae bacterium]|nr:porin [Helicobacteraceae bacterium]
DVGGLTAVYQLEAGFNGVKGDSTTNVVGGSTGGGNGDNTLASRNTFVGIAGGFGTFVIGNHDTPYKIAARGAGAISSADTVADLHLLVDRRLKGAVAYIAPADALGGVTVALAVVPHSYKDGEEGNQKQKSGQHYSLGVLAPIGDTGLTIGAGYESAYAPTVDERANSFFVAAKFKQDLFSVGLAFESIDAEDAYTAAAKAYLDGKSGDQLDKANKDLEGLVDKLVNAGVYSKATRILLPVSLTLDDGIYVNLAAALSDYDTDDDELAISLSAGKKWGKYLDAYVGVKNVTNANGASKDADYTDFGAGIRVSFN